MYMLIFFAVSFLASIAGSICGIGGGVIIKPVLDATGAMGVAAISFLSGCTVLAMSLVSVGKQLRRGEKLIEIRTGTPLAIGAALGGILGQKIFQYAYVILPNEDLVGAVQAGVLIFVTAATFLYTLKKDKIKTLHVKNLVSCFVIGLILGMMSAFLGIGGGPINLMVLGFFFSMDTKKAAANSLYIIMFSQAASFLSTVLQGKVPEFHWMLLVLMVCGGVLGATLGGKINKTLSAKDVNRLFCLLMALIIFINIYNVVRFTVL